jgi:hypothetical protein
LEVVCSNGPDIVGKEGIVGVGDGERLEDLPSPASRGGLSADNAKGWCSSGLFGDADSSDCSISCPT